MHKELETELKEISKEVGVSPACFHMLLNHANNYQRENNSRIRDDELFEIVKLALQYYDYNYEGKIQRDGDEASQRKTSGEMFGLAVSKLTGEPYTLKIKKGNKFH